MPNAIEKYGSPEAALARLAALSVEGRALDAAESAELADLQAVEGALRSAPPRVSMPADRRQTPLDWWRERRGKWPQACLAAALRGWEASDPDEMPLVTEAEYDGALAAADSKVEECRAKAGADARRVFVLAHPTDMKAVVCVKPQPGDVARILRNLASDEGSPEQREALGMHEVWSRTLWPAEGSAERAALWADDPGAAGVNYPTAYMRAIGVSGRDVRGK